MTGASGPLPLPPYGPPPAKKGPNTTLIAVIVGAAVVLVIGCCSGLYIIGSQQDPDGTAAPQATATVGAVPPGAGPSTARLPTPAETTAAQPTSTAVPVKTVTMPKVIGENAAVADDKLRKLGFTNISYGSQDEDDKVVLLLTNWTVAKQSTKAGAKVKTDTLIVLTCTKEG